MKKRTHRIRSISVLVALIMLFSVFAACSDTSENSSSADVSSKSPEFSSESSSAVLDGSSNADSSDDITDSSSQTASSDTDSSSDTTSASDTSDVTSVPDESDTTSAPDVSDPEPDPDPDPEPEPEPEPEPKPQFSKKDAFRLSSLDDVTDENGSRTYIVYAPYTDSYKLVGTNINKITLSDKYGETVKSGKTSISVSLKADEAYSLTVETDGDNKDFKVTTTAENHLVTLPYDVATPEDVSGIDVNGTTTGPIKPSKVEYIPREGGTYVYSNNPEMFGSQHVGRAFMRNEGLTGDVYVTFEHANYSGRNVYLGYQLKNNSDHDVYITVTNVGYQWIGTWFGQLAWYDFYNTSFKLPADYLTSTGAISSKYAGLDYAYRNYNPRVYQPTTYRLPAGEYIWVIGGTSADAYRNINIDNSANHYVNPVRCANGNVKFIVSGGEVTGTMYCYTDASQVASDPAALGYMAGNYSQQYSGIAHHHGVIDNYMSWTFNDDIGSGMLPVTYTNYYANSVPAKTTPYAAYNSTAHTVTSSTTWMTHLNPQNDHRAVGMDMVEFIWHDSRGNEIIIDNDHADGGGNPANTANWMIEYQDHFTFVNQGDNDRTITLHLRDHGSLALLVRDSQTGEVIDTAFTAGLGENSSVFSNYKYEIVIPAHSVKQITLDYLLVACSYGSVNHAVSIK